MCSGKDTFTVLVTISAIYILLNIQEEEGECIVRQGGDGGGGWEWGILRFIMLARQTI